MYEKFLYYMVETYIKIYHKHKLWKVFLALKSVPLRWFGYAKLCQKSWSDFTTEQVVVKSEGAKSGILSAHSHEIRLLVSGIDIFVPPPLTKIER